MLNILSSCRKLVPRVCKSSILLDRIGVLRSVCPAHRASYHSPCAYPVVRAKLASCQRWHPVNGSHLHTKRLYSDDFGERSDGLSQADEMGRDRRQRSPVTFSLDVLVSLLRQENAVDICVIKVPDRIKYADYFIVVSGVSARHLRAMALYSIKVYKFLKKEGEPHVKIEGKDTEDWMCIDFGNMVVHFMLPETREAYELEKLWTLRAYDEQLRNIPPETLPEDFIYDLEVTK